MIMHIMKIANKSPIPTKTIIKNKAAGKQQREIQFYRHSQACAHAFGGHVPGRCSLPAWIIMMKRCVHVSHLGYVVFLAPLLVRGMTASDTHSYLEAVIRFPKKYPDPMLPLLLPLLLLSFLSIRLIPLFLPLLLELTGQYTTIQSIKQLKKLFSCRKSQLAFLLKLPISPATLSRPLSAHSRCTTPSPSTR